MDKLPSHLRDRYSKDRQLLPDDESGSAIINYSDALRGYYFLIDYFENSDHDEKMFAGLRSPDLLASAISRQEVKWENKSKWRNPIDISATLFFGLIKNHAFYDGNKRIALLMLLLSLRRINRVVKCYKKEIEDFTVTVAASELKNKYPKKYAEFLNTGDPEIHIISDFIRSRTRKLDHSYRSITFRELKHALNKFNCDLNDTYGNTIGVFRPSGEGDPARLNTELVRVGRIGFPSWTKQVGPTDFRNVQILTGLTEVNGYDSEVLFNNTEQAYRLIQEFEGPLTRLKDR